MPESPLSGEQCRPHYMNHCPSRLRVVHCKVLGGLPWPLLFYALVAAAAGTAIMVALQVHLGRLPHAGPPVRGIEEQNTQGTAGQASPSIVIGHRVRVVGFIAHGTTRLGHSRTRRCA